jgi:UDPglucose 6-dehydrogenase
LAVLLSRENEVIAFDINAEKVDLINKRRSPINDKDIQEYMSNSTLNMHATINKKEAYENAEIVIIATPTDYNEIENTFNTESVENVIYDVTKVNQNALIVIKSTIPIGFVEKNRLKYKTKNIIFSPEFLREGKALHDNLYPKRIVIGEDSKRAKNFANLLRNASLNPEVPVLFTGATEAEAIKLFANSYLAMRVGFFNELDNYSIKLKLNTRQIIDGVCMDERIGNHYKNPSFGYGGYCLPKDTKQLLSNFEKIPQSIISAIVSTNEVRKDVIADEIIKKAKNNSIDEAEIIIGVYKLAMKKYSDNHRSSAIIGIIERLAKQDLKIVIYDPSVNEKNIFGMKIEKEIIKFKRDSSLILANRIDEEIADVNHKIYTRDIYNSDE